MTSPVSFYAWVQNGVVQERWNLTNQPFFLIAASPCWLSEWGLLMRLYKAGSSSPFKTGLVSFTNKNQMRQSWLFFLSVVPARGWCQRWIFSFSLLFLITGSLNVSKGWVHGNVAKKLQEQGGNEFLVVTAWPRLGNEGMNSLSN